MQIQLTVTASCYEVIIKDGNTTITTGLLDKQEAVELRMELLAIAENLPHD